MSSTTTSTGSDSETDCSSANTVAPSRKSRLLEDIKMLHECRERNRSKRESIQKMLIKEEKNVPQIYKEILNRLEEKYNRLLFENNQLRTELDMLRKCESENNIIQ